MPAAYDEFDYPAYWSGREYEHQSEVIALTAFLNRIKNIERVLDVGSGYGRLTPYYIHRARRAVLIDPSTKLLKTAKRRLLTERHGELWRKKLTFYQSRIENAPKKFRGKSFDLAIMVRVIHHLEHADRAFGAVDKLLASGGYVVLEFPNKLNWKTLGKNLIRGNFLYPFEIYPHDKRSKRSISKKALPFLNFHPDIMKEMLINRHYDIVEVRSVSNVRSQTLKRNIPESVLLFIEEHLQKPLAKFSFGPSIFILARKK